MSKPVVWGALAVVLMASAALYLTRLSVVPPYLMHDEVNFSLQAHAISTTGRDTNGRFMPVYFSEIGFEAGRDPLMIFWTAAWLTVLPLSDATVRFPTALLGVISIGLMFVTARRMFGDTFALVAAAFLAVTPGFFTNTRLALSITYGIPFALAWLYCARRAEVDSGRWPVAAGLWLGLGLYSYLASTVLMPVYLLATVILFWSAGRMKATVAMIAGFSMMMLPLAGWLIYHPDRFTNIATAYAITGDNPITMRDRLTAFWMFFNPDYLFISGDGRMTNSTRVAGLFPIAFAFLIPIGLIRLARGVAGVSGRLVVAGFLLAPLATAASGRLDINRVLITIPFGVLAAVAGLLFAVSFAKTAKRSQVFVAMLLLSIAAQSVVGYRYYFGSYRVAAGTWFGGDNRYAINAVLDRIVDRTGAQVYLDRRTPIERYWRLYAAARERDDLANIPAYYDSLPSILQGARVGALVVCEGREDPCASLGSGWAKKESVFGADGASTHQIYVRER